MSTKHVSILLFEGCDLLDAGGPYEVFLTASRLAERTGEQKPFTVDTVTADGEPVTAYGGLGLIPSAPPEVRGTWCRSGDSRAGRPLALLRRRG